MISALAITRAIAVALAAVALFYLAWPTPQPSPSRELKVVGGGLGRTGTMTLARALDELGVGPTYHWETMIHDHFPQHWLKWYRWMKSTNQEEYFRLGDEMLEGYGSVVDFPSAGGWHKLVERHPNAKVILTVRSSASDWAKSAHDTVFVVHHRHSIADSLKSVLGAVGLIYRYFNVAGKLIEQTSTFEEYTKSLNVENLTELERFYENHNRKVVEGVPKEQLLIYNVKEGWEPLCEFLEILNCPRTEFPYTNAKAGFIANFIPFRWLVYPILGQIPSVYMLLKWRERRRKKRAIAAAQSKKKAA